jgi:uncharacterized membrane protein YtjA (UPF0391 family)
MGLLKWALICLLISLVAGAFGYTGLARGAGQLSKILFVIFLVYLDPGAYRRRDHFLKPGRNLVPW